MGISQKYNYIMLDIKYTEFINEDMALGDISTRKIRDAMHDIVVELGPKETIDVEKMADVLTSEYKINISSFFIDKFLDDFIKRKKDSKVKTFFQKSDMKWLGVIDVKGVKEIRNNYHHLRPNLAKHKRKLYDDEDMKKIDDAYKAGMKDLSFSEDVIKKSLILQKPSDSETIMKIIYNEVVMRNRYENTYDNCWKLMMIYGRNYKLDRVRGWFKLAPQSVKDEFNRGEKGHQKINYELTKPKNKKENIKRNLHDPPETKKNLSIIDKHLNKYKRWGEFISDTTLRDLIGLIDSLQIKTAVDNKLHEFLSKIDQLNFILIRYYRVDKKDVITFYMKTGLANYIRKWESAQIRPKINDF